MAISAGEMAISVSFVAVKNEFSATQNTLLIILWSFLFITILFALFAFWGRFKLQLDLSHKIRTEKTNYVFVNSKLYNVINKIVILMFFLSNTLLFCIGIILV